MQHTVPYLVAVVQAKRFAALNQRVELGRLRIEDERRHDQRIARGCPHGNRRGFDPTDNSVYVGDEPSEGEYRVYKLGNRGEFLASVSFKPAHPFVLERIALDPARERIYVLAVALLSNAASITP
jgi:hypothetical protein